MPSNLRRLRLAAALSVDELAARTCLGRATIVRAERGVRTSTDTVWRLELALRRAIVERQREIEAACRSARVRLPTS